MTFDALLGPAFPELGWVPAPRYLMRRARIHALARDLSPGRLLEVGPGAGTLLMEYTDRGFRCEGLEPSMEAREVAERLLLASHRQIPVHALPRSDWRESFDVIFSFDVLEHIEQDAEALAQWFAWLRPGGHMLLSVPAHMHLWTAGDEWAGHFRRYERESLLALLKREGFEVDVFECYGFPLTNFTERASDRIYRKMIRHHAGSIESDRQDNNDRSGVDRRPHLRAYPLLSSGLGRLALRTFLNIQRMFLGSDLGSGYILRARRPEETAPPITTHHEPTNSEAP